MSSIIGIDLAGSEKRDTGFCVITGRMAQVEILHTDAEILASLRALKGEKLIGIDAPLSLPKGRKSIGQRSPHHFRKCDLALRELGIRFFPITLGPMRMLTKRGMALKRKIEKSDKSARVFEVYPGATYDIFGIPRKNKAKILSWARKTVRLPPRPYTQDELDAIAAALTMKLFMEKTGRAIGDKREGEIIVPTPAAPRRFR